MNAAMTAESILLRQYLDAIELMAGQKIPITSNIPFIESHFKTSLNIGYSQFNEIMLLLGYDRVSPSFFQYLVNGSFDSDPSSVIDSVETIKWGAENFVKKALLLFGNVKFAFKQLSNNSTELRERVGTKSLTPAYFIDRHPPVLPLEPIQENQTYFLGYIVQAELKKRLQDPEDSEAKDLDAIRASIVQKGINNQLAYLASDHMDVYVATSMRQKHEFLFISRITKAIFDNDELKNLQIRYFDPTQAYCPDRIDKGISEALMLKRAECTIYLAQEADTLGKDSELASTLAQGKTVVAFIPNGDEQFVKELLSDLKALDSSKSEKEILIEQLKVFAPDEAWRDKTLRTWIDDGTENTYAFNLLLKAVKEHYDKRANNLKDNHPLGIQVNLNTGVANGVLVVRTIEQCAKLVRSILMKSMQFRLEVTSKNYLLLREVISDCIYRVATGDLMLTNTFWNFYVPSIDTLDPNFKKAISRYRS
jgi:hypothetical protein